jgi:hypothetical protein
MNCNQLNTQTNYEEQQIENKTHTLGLLTNKQIDNKNKRWQQIQPNYFSWQWVLFRETG